MAYHNLDVIISASFMVNSLRGIPFHIWATQVLCEYLVKGFAMNDDLLKRAGGGRSHLQQGRCGQGFYVADIMDLNITETDGCRDCQELPLSR